LRDCSDQPLGIELGRGNHFFRRQPGVAGIEQRGIHNVNKRDLRSERQREIDTSLRRTDRNRLTIDRDQNLF
jgi:hypothetical protein